MVLTPESQIMRWSRVFAVSSVLFLGVGLGIDNEAFAIKPRPPLKLSLTNSDLPDGQIELTLKAEAFVVAGKIELMIDLPPSALLVSGEVKWVGTITVGEKKALTAFIRTGSNIPAKVIGVASVYLPQGGLITQQETVLLHPPLEKALPPPEPPIKRKRGNETILEFKGK